jgi:hypothetical protein
MSDPTRAEAIWGLVKAPILLPAWIVASPAYRPLGSIQISLLEPSPARSQLCSVPPRQFLQE